MKEAHVLRARNLSSESTATAFTRRMDTKLLVSGFFCGDCAGRRGEIGCTVEEVAQAEKHHFSARELAVRCRRDGM